MISIKLDTASGKEGVGTTEVIGNWLGTLEDELGKIETKVVAKGVKLSETLSVADTEMLVDTLVDETTEKP